MSYGAFFNEENQSRTQEAINAAPSTGQDNESVKVPGTYLMKVKSFVMRKKNEDPKPFPSVIVSSKASTLGDLQLNLCFEVVDGTEATPAGAGLFYTLTLVKSPEADKTKAENTVKFMKPIICALVGQKNFNFTEAFVTENLTIGYDPTNGKITRDHKMKPVMCVVEESVNPNNGRVGCRIKSIRAASLGDKSVSIKVEAQETASLDNQVIKNIKQGQGSVKVESINDDLSYNADMDSDTSANFTTTVEDV